MTEPIPIQPDTSDMVGVHQVFRSSLESAPTFIDSAADNDDRRALIANYYANLLAFLEVHHKGEEELLFPLLIERSPQHRDEIERANEEHHGVLGLLSDAKDATVMWEAKGDAEELQLVEAFQALHEALSPHLDREEEEILPLADQHISVEEWGMLPGHGFANFTGDKVWLIIGLIRENFTPEQCSAMLEHMPPPAREMWENMGENAFSAMMAEVRQTN